MLFGKLFKKTPKPNKVQVIPADVVAGMILQLDEEWQTRRDLADALTNVAKDIVSDFPKQAMCPTYHPSARPVVMDMSVLECGQAVTDALKYRFARDILYTILNEATIEL